MTLSRQTTEITFGQVPHTAHSVTLAVRVTPKSGGLLMYTSPDDTQPLVACKGPAQHITIGYGTGRIFVEKLAGTTDFEIKIVGWG